MGNMPPGSADSAISGVNCDYIRCEEWLYQVQRVAISAKEKVVSWFTTYGRNAV